MAWRGVRPPARAASGLTCLIRSSRALHLPGRVDVLHPERHLDRHLVGDLDRHGHRLGQRQEFLNGGEVDRYAAAGRQLQARPASLDDAAGEDRGLLVHALDQIGESVLIGAFLPASAALRALAIIFRSEAAMTVLSFTTVP